MSAARASSGFTNPVITTNQPDPGILRTPEGYYLYSTAGAEDRKSVV